MTTLSDRHLALDSYLISRAPESMYYIHGFITPEEEQALLNSIPEKRWITLAHRKLQALPGQLTNKNTLFASPLPEWLVNPVIDRLENLELFRGAPHGINHCLINEYEPGQGIMPHEDGPAYYPIVATVSLGAPVVLNVVTKDQGQLAGLQSKPPIHNVRIFQEPRSLLVTTGRAYTECLHGIDEILRDEDLNPGSICNWELLASRDTITATGGSLDRKTRVSLTFRDVIKVSRIATKLFGKPRT